LNNTAYKGKCGRELPSDASVPDELNDFNVHFEESNTAPYVRAPAFRDNYLIMLSHHALMDLLMGRPSGGEGRQQHILHSDPEHGSPSGCMFSPLLYSLFTHDCVAMYNSNTIITFAKNMMVVGLINVDDEIAYREEVRDLAVLCQDNNLSLNVGKTKELIVDYCHIGMKRFGRQAQECVIVFKN
jgi:hypothetical protein